MYADDIVLYNNNSNYRLTERAVQIDPNAVSEWCDLNSMTINVKENTVHVDCI